MASQRLGSAPKAGREGIYMHISKVEVRASTSMANRQSKSSTPSLPSRGAPAPRPASSNDAMNMRTGSSDKRLPNLLTKSQNPGAIDPNLRGPRISNLQLDIDVDNSASNSKMHGSALGRPSSAVHRRPESGKSRPVSAKFKPQTAASSASTVQGKTGSAVSNSANRPNTAWANDHIDAEMRELSAIESEDSTDHRTFHSKSDQCLFSFH
jgi:hypothetical protein